MKLKIRKKNLPLLIFIWCFLEQIEYWNAFDWKVNQVSKFTKQRWSYQRTSSVTSRTNLFLQNNVVNDYFLPYVALRCQAERWQEERKVLH